jgi:hypothetical protein
MLERVDFLEPLFMTDGLPPRGSTIAMISTKTSAGGGTSQLLHLSQTGVDVMLLLLLLLREVVGSRDHDDDDSDDSTR